MDSGQAVPKALPGPDTSRPPSTTIVVPVGRLQAADEVAAVVVFLASPGGDYITGTTITADGGLDVAGPGIAVL